MYVFLPAVIHYRFSAIRFACILLLFAMFSCNSKEKLVINCCPDEIAGIDHNSIIYLVESGNVGILKDSADMVRFLSAKEISGAFDSITDPISEPKSYRKIVYKDYGSMLTEENYEADLLLVILNDLSGREYYFQLRTYDHDRRLIDFVDFATWSDTYNILCTGVIHENNLIEKSCATKNNYNNNTEKKLYRISEDGRFHPLEQL